MCAEISKAAFDPLRFKEQERAGFNFVADRYEPAMSALKPVFEKMLQLADFAEAPHKAWQVLDVASGPGTLASLARRRLGAGGKVLGLDIAEQTVARAQQLASEEGLDGLVFEVADAEKMNLPDATFDRVLCSLGLMHFPDPAAALHEIERVLKPGGKLVAAVWGTAETVPFIQIALATISRNFPPPKVERPSMFRFGQPAVLQSLLEEAGFSQVKTASAEIGVTVPDAAAYWQKFLAVAGITAIAFAGKPPEMLANLEKDSLSDLAAYRKGNVYDLTSRLVLVTGTK